MFGGRKTNYHKLKTNLRLCINRLKLMEKKKTELTLKARKDISDYIGAGKEDRARIRVEHIVREDYLVEAMEIVEMFCDLLLARFGILERMSEMDPGLEEAIATLIWVTPRMNSDINELQEVSNQLTAKYGKEFAEQCRSNSLENVNEKVLHKMSIFAPPKVLIEQYMIEIAKSYNVPFEPDPTALSEHAGGANVDELICFDPSVDNAANENKDRRGPGGGGGGGGMPAMPYKPAQPAGPTAVPGPYPYMPPPAGMNPPAPGFVDPSPALPARGPNQGTTWATPPPGEPPAPGRPESLPPYTPMDAGAGPSGRPSAPPPTIPALPDLPELPSVPAGGSVATGGGEDVDFDDLTRRFEDLKRKK